VSARSSHHSAIDVSVALRYREVVAAERSEEHLERAQRAQQLSDRARELAGGERAAAERCERLMADASDPGLREIHRQAAGLHRQALDRYEEAARFQQLHAEHERNAAERALSRETARRTDPGASADRRDVVADDRDHFAEVRQAAADERERRADTRERQQDARGERQLGRERRFEEASGWPVGRQRDQLAQLTEARNTLSRLEARLERTAAELNRDIADVSRDQAAIDRESATTARNEPGNRPGDEAA
jgi:hypothetical protein